MRLVLVAKQQWDIITSRNECSAVSSSNSPSSSRRTGANIALNATSQQPAVRQLKWKDKYVPVHVLITRSVKRSIGPRIQSCTTSKGAWDTQKQPLYSKE